jgi:heme-degrading monooxygenase HmoA
MADGSPTILRPKLEDARGGDGEFDRAPRVEEMMYVQFVKFKSGLADDQVRSTMEKRAPQFRAIPGLVQKYYVRERGTGEYAGIYFWESEAALKEFRSSDLARSIPEAYEVTGAPRIEILEVLFPLRGAKVTAD